MYVRNRRAAYFLFFFALTATVQCSPEARYKVLTAAFDGVPEPTSEQLQDSLANDSLMRGSLVQNSGDQQSSLFIHEAYEGDSCEDCHDRDEGFSLVEKPPGLCYTCHDDYGDKYAVLHGPVASGSCTTCHNPHKSRYEYLLTREKEQLCLFCHQSTEIIRTEEHEEFEGDTCLDCHDSHGIEEGSLDDATGTEPPPAQNDTSTGDRSEEAADTTSELYRSIDIWQLRMKPDSLI